MCQQQELLAEHRTMQNHLGSSLSAFPTTAVHRLALLTQYSAAALTQPTIGPTIISLQHLLNTWSHPTC